MSKKTASGQINKHPGKGKITSGFVQPGALGLVLVLVLYVGLPSTALTNEQCSIVPERQLVDAILNQDQSLFAKRLAQLEEQDAVIPSKKFYDAMNTWHLGYQKKIASEKNIGIKLLIQSIQDLEDQLDDNNPDKRNIALGLTKGHTARILLENEQYLTGYNLGVEAKNHIELVLKNATNDTPGFNDAGFLLGLYEIYTADLASQDHWLVGRIAKNGNRSRGLALVENAIVHNSIFATEALRASLGEVSWQTPDFCRYVDRIDNAGIRYPRNSDLSVLRQGLLLKCGHVIRAQQANAFYRTQSDLPQAMLDQVDKAWLRISADLGDVAALEQKSLTRSQDPYLQLARANALDVLNRRKEAIDVYQNLLKNNNPIPQIQSVARIRLKHPYTAPQQVNTPQKAILHPGTCL
jgi:hypothetical protein